MLNKKYLYQWNGRKRRIDINGVRLSRSFDLTLLDYLLGRYVKDIIVYSKRPTTPKNMIARITAMLEDISSQVLKRAEAEQISNRIE